VVGSRDSDLEAPHLDLGSVFFFGLNEWSGGVVEDHAAGGDPERQARAEAILFEDLGESLSGGGEALLCFGLHNMHYQAYS
jgi:hypothetical protein